MAKHPRPDREQDDLFSDVEQLESRQMLAGNVTAAISGSGNLIINGDGDDNDISVTINQLGGVTIEANDGETIDDSGLAGAVVSGDVKINMKGGDDSVILTSEYEIGPRGFGIPVGDITMIGGGGNDYLGAGYLYGFGGDLKMTGGGGDDSMLVKYASASGDINITGGSGNDEATVAFTNSDDLKISQGGGDDGVYLIDGSANGKMSISVASGDNEVNVTDGFAATEGVLIRGGGGIDDIRIGDMYLGNSDADLVIRSGGGDDTVLIENSSVSGELDVNTGGGDDSVAVKYEIAPPAARGGPPLGSNFGSVKFTLGGGDDSLGILGDVNGSGTANGGGGSDYLGNLAGPGFTLDDTKFETFAED